MSSKKKTQRRWFPFILAAAVLPCCSCRNSFFLQVQHPTLKGKYDHTVFLFARLGLFLSKFILTYRAATLRQEATAVLHLQWPPLCGSAVGHVTWLALLTYIPPVESQRRTSGRGRSIDDPPPPPATCRPAPATGERRSVFSQPAADCSEGEAFFPAALAAWSQHGAFECKNLSS